MEMGNHHSTEEMHRLELCHRPECISEVIDESHT